MKTAKVCYLKTFIWSEKSVYDLRTNNYIQPWIVPIKPIQLKAVITKGEECNHIHSTPYSWKTSRAEIFEVKQIYF